MTSLAGRWVELDQKGESIEQKTHVRSMAGDSDLVEALFPGSPHEILGIYHLDERSLMLTYYSILQNQPRMRDLPMKDKNVIDVEFSDGTNMASTNGSHMHHAVFTFVDKDHYTVKWTNYENGESAYTVVLNMARASE